MTVDEVLALPVMVPVPDAGRALGISRATAYRAAKTGALAPGVPVVSINGGVRIGVPRVALLRALGIKDPTSEAA